MKSLCGILLFVAYLCTSVAHTLPKNFDKCKVTDEACLLRRTNAVLRSYPQGFDDLHLARIDPLNVKLIRIAGSPKSPVNLELTLSEQVLRGLSNLTFTKFSGFTKNPKDIKEFQFEGMVPHIITVGKYKASGKFLVIPIVGDGDINISIKNLQLKAQIKATAVEKNGGTYIKLDKAQIKAKADRIHIEATNLFNGEKTLADTTLKVINENWELFWDEISPQVINEILLSIKAILETFLDNVSYEEMFA